LTATRYFIAHQWNTAIHNVLKILYRRLEEENEVVNLFPLTANAKDYHTPISKGGEQD